MSILVKYPANYYNALGLSVEIDLQESFAKLLAARSSGDLITATDPTIQSTAEVI